MITADAQYLGPLLLQSAVVLPKCSRLRGSAGGEIEHMEGEYDVLLTSELGETDGLIIGRRQGKVGGNLSDVSRHRLSFLVVSIGRLCEPVALPMGILPSRFHTDRASMHLHRRCS
jgi:hypothetical protein